MINNKLVEENKTISGKAGIRKSIYMQLVMITALLAGIILNGCGKEENPVDGNNPPAATSGYPAPTNFNGVQPKNALVIVRTSITQMGFSFSMGVGVANLDGQDKGTVSATVSSEQYDFQKMNSGGSVSYLYAPSATNPTGGITLGSGATSVKFSVSNYSLSSNTVVVPGELTLTSPAANAPVSRSSNLNVTWSISGAGTNSAIFIVDKNGKSIFKEVSGNSGAFTASEMGTLSAGEGAMVYGISYNYVLINNNEAVLIGETVAVNNITLQ